MRTFEEIVEQYPVGTKFRYSDDFENTEYSYIAIGTVRSHIRADDNPVFPNLHGLRVEWDSPTWDGLLDIPESYFSTEYPDGPTEDWDDVLTVIE